MGIAMSSSGAGGALAGLLMPRFIESYGWRNGYLMLAVIYFIITVPLVLFLVRDNPESVGLKAYGEKEKNINNSSTTKIRGVSFEKALKTPHFFMLYIGFVIISMIVSFYQHVPAFFIGTGFTPVLAGSLMSIYMLSLIAAKIIIGILHDKGGSVLCIIFCYSLYIAAFILLPLGAGYGISAIGMILMAFGTGTTTVLPALFTSEKFGQKNYAKILGIMGTAGAVGMALGTPLWGYIFDKTSSYNVGFYGTYVLLPIAIILLVLAIKKPLTQDMDRMH